MKRLLLLLLALVVVVMAVAFAWAKLPTRTRAIAGPPPGNDPALVEQGRYLALIGDCTACHTRPGGKPFAGGLPVASPIGTIFSTNITPDRETGIGEWTDGEILRAIREGVDRKGRTLFPMMPYEEYRKMSDEDAKAIVAYLRSMPPVRFDAPRTDLDFPIRFFMKGVPKPLDGPVPEVDRNDPVKYGKYLTDISVCMFCHSPVDAQHQPIQDKLFAGGHPLLGQWGVVRSANLTFHPTGLGNRTKEEFIAVFRSFSDPSKAPVVKNNEGTGMPWYDLAGMSDEDLGAIYDYLRSLPPQDNVVEKHPKEPLGPKKSG